MGNCLKTCFGKKTPPPAPAPVTVDISKLKLFQTTDFSDERSAPDVRTGTGVPDLVKRNIGDATKLVEAISTNGEALNKDNFASKLPAEMKTVISDALRKVGEFNWIAVGFSMIAFVLDRIQLVSSNFDKCVQVLDMMFDISKRLTVLQERMPHEREALSNAVEAIVEGVIACCCCMRQGNFFRYMLAATNEAELQRIEKVMERLYRELGLLIAMDIQGQIAHSHYPSEYKAPVEAVGIDGRIEEVIQLLDMSHRDTGPARAVILHGFGGVGKTTLADCVMAKLDFTGFRHSRIQLYETETHLEKYQEQLYADLTRPKLAFKNSDEGKQKLKEILERETTFIFIDNALAKEHINNLFPSQLSLPSRSRLLLTSRKLDVIQELRFRNIDCKDYRVTELPNEAAKEYFRNVVLRSQQVRSAIKNKGISLAQIDAVAKRCLGVPLLLRVYGQYLEFHGSDPEIYDGILHALEQGNFNVGGEDSVSARLQYVYRTLDQNHKDAFVDICTYFQGWEMDEVSLIFDKIELIALVDGGMVNIDPSGKVVVHDLFRSMGIKEGKDTRVQNLPDMTAASAQKKTLKGIWLLQDQDLFNLEYEQLLATKDCLRVLALARPIGLTNECAVSLPQLRFLHIENLDNVPILDKELPALRYIIWKFPKNSPSVPSQRVLGNIKNLTCLQKFVLHFSALDKFPSGFKFPESLKELDLSHSRELQELPHDLGNLTMLRRLTLDSCVRLKCLPAVFGQLSCLQRLNLSDCSDLKELPASFVSLRKLEVLTLTRCHSLQCFPDGFGNLSSLKSLILNGCESLKSLPGRFVELKALKSLDLTGCESLQSLPEGFGNLENVESLNLSGCKRLESLPDGFGNLSSLKSLILNGCESLKSLPGRFVEPKALKSLDLTGCESLQSLPEGFGNLENVVSLNLTGCKTLQSLPEGFGNLENVVSLNLTGCKRLQSLPERFGNLRSLKSLVLNGCESLKSLPDRFVELTALKSLDLCGCDSLQSLPEGFGNLENVVSLNLSGCKRLQSLPDGFGNLSTLNSLVLNGCKTLQSLPDGFGNLSTLKLLGLNGCKKLTSLPARFVELKALKSLDLSGCENLLILPEEFGNLENLESLNLSGCKRLQSLPDGFDNLKALKSLDLRGCESLQSLPDLRDRESLQILR